MTLRATAGATTASGTPAYRQRIKVRLGETDVQGVVFNANYLAYVDDAVDRWFIEALGDEYQRRFDVMVKKATIEWSAPARAREGLDLEARLARWGNTSFDVVVSGSVGERAVFEATLVYISVTPGGHAPTAAPEWVRSALGP